VKEINRDWFFSGQNDVAFLISKVSTLTKFISFLSLNKFV